MVFSVCIINVHNVSKPSSHGIPTHLLFLGLGFCVYKNGLGLQVRGSYSWAYLPHHFYLCNMKTFSYYKPKKLTSEKKHSIFQASLQLFTVVSVPFLSLLNKGCQKQDEDTEKAIQEEWSLLLYKRAIFWKGNYLRFFLMLVTTWTGKLYITGLEMREGTNVISSSETRPFLFQTVKSLRKAGIYKKLFRLITVSPF